jgi:hypothetical protein
MDVLADWLNTRLSTINGLGAASSSNVGPVVRSYAPREGKDGYNVQICGGVQQVPFYRILDVNPSSVIGRLPASATALPTANGRSLFLDASSVRENAETAKALDALAAASPGGCIAMVPCDDKAKRWCCPEEPVTHTYAWFLVVIMSIILFIVVLLVAVALQKGVFPKIRFKF